MIVMFILAIFVFFTAQTSLICFSYQGVNRAVINTPIEAMYSSIRFEDGEQYFDKEVLENKLLNYYDASLSRYTKNMEIEFYYYNIDDGSMCLTNKCNAVEISVDCKLTFDVKYHRVMYYEIKGGLNG